MSSQSTGGIGSSQSLFLKLKLKAASLPLKPGVYIMLDKDGGVIYVGKAKALKNRVSSYFQENADHTPKTRRMVARVADFDTIIAQSEFEALVLERSLIRRHQPKYNILLKHGKGYPFIAVNVKAPFPNFEISYTPKEGGSTKYFGPYGAYPLTVSVIAAIKHVLGLPVCDKKFPRDIGKGRPCLESHLKRCVTVCGGEVTEEAYKKLIRQGILLLEGDAGKLRKELEAEMEEASEALLFEKAIILRNKILAISALERKQTVVGGGMADTDVIGCYTGEVKCGIAVMHYKDGELLSRDFEIFDEVSDGAEALYAFMMQYYPSRRRAPKNIFLSVEMEDIADIEEYIFTKTGYKTHITVPKRGDKHDLVEFALTNAREEVVRLTTKEEKSRKLTELFGKMLNIGVLPRRIEAIDISNTGEDERVGALTCFIDGRPLKRGYKLFIIDENINDDYHAMENVLRRRLLRKKAESEGFEELPDLFLVDGGAAHASMAARVMSDLEFNIPVFGMVKDSHHKTRALVAPNGDEVAVSGEVSIFALVGKIQEETHRSAVEFHRKRRSKALVK